MNSLIDKLTHPRPSANLNKSSVFIASNPVLPNPTSLFVQQTVTNLPQKLNLLSLEKRLDPHELILLQKALMLLEIELSLSPAYQQSLALNQTDHM